jgi:hypothetical protein
MFHFSCRLYFIQQCRLGGGGAEVANRQKFYCNNCARSLSNRTVDFTESPVPEEVGGPEYFSIRAIKRGSNRY